MTRTGTRRRNRSYTYYTCAGCHEKGKSVCRGRHVPVAKLDALIIENIKERLFAPERLAKILEFSWKTNMPRIVRLRTGVPR